MFIAGSPDGIVTCKCHGQSSLEVKCPYNLRNQSVQVRWKETGFSELAADGTISLKKKPNITHRFNPRWQLLV